ncbi:MAG TPA: hypothetical protein VN328_08895 [Thermodesulfovibrionales bacterium]|nr:hypothetical protein [Thermodesulfovibrionales bacterium]
MKNRRVLLSAFFLLLLAVSMSFAGTIVVKPGKFDHFVIEFPERMVAGEGFVVRAFVYDISNNLITHFPESGKDFKVTVSGSANVQPSRLDPASFPGGVANIMVTSRKAERVTLSINTSDSNKVVYSKEITVLPGKLDHFVMDVPSVATAGSSFEATIVAKDAFDNTTSDSQLASKNLVIVSHGISSLKNAEVLAFRDGTASARLLTEKTGDLAFEVVDTLSGKKGRSPVVKVKPAAVGYFKVQAPSEATAGESFDVVVSAFDLFGNAVNDYASTGSGVVLKSSGRASLEPSVVKPSQFRNNEAVVRVVYERAEDIIIAANEENKPQQSGKSGTIKIYAPSADHFSVLTPDSAEVGQPFRIKVEAYDRFNNLVKNFHLTGSTVALKATGTGNLSPSVVSPSAFVEGVASVEVTYDKAEAFGISAVMPSAEGSERVRKETRPVEKKEADKAKKPAQAQSREKRKEQATPLEIKKGKEEVVKEAKAEKPPKEVKKETKKEEGAEVVKEAKAEKPPKEIKKETKQEELGKAVSLNNISTIEAKEKAMIVLTLSPDGKFEFKEEIETRQGKEWLKIRLKPVVRKTGKSFKFKSAFIGDVLVEDDKAEQGVVNIFVELVPEKVSFDVAQLKNSLVVTIAKP